MEKNLFNDFDKISELSNNELYNISGGVTAEEAGRAVGHVVGFTVGYLLFGGLIAGVLIGKKILN